MCGIAGLFLKDDALAERLGDWLATMLEALSDRGPDSTGAALYSNPRPEAWRISIRRDSPQLTWDAVESAVGALGDAGEVREIAGPSNMATITTLSNPCAWLGQLPTVVPGLEVVASGRHVDVVKDRGDAASFCRRYGIRGRHGYQAIGHTRMATESAVTTRHCHPFSPTPDLCLVHNGSFVNHATIRRALRARGVTFDSDNDSEVAARFVGQHLSDGSSLATALEQLLHVFDGFFTLLVTTADEFAAVRDAVACKPLVVVETDTYVAMASEYQALAALPGVENATVVEPVPGHVLYWKR